MGKKILLTTREKIADIIITVSLLSCIGTAVGALTGWGLSFITLPALVRGGIIGSALPVLFVVWGIGKLLYNLYNGKGIEEEDKNKLVYSSKVALAFAAIGVVLAAVGLTSGGDIGAITMYIYFAIVHAVKEIKLCFSKEQDRYDLPQSPLTNEDGKPPSTSVNDTTENNPSDGISFSLSN